MKHFFWILLIGGIGIASTIIVLRGIAWGYDISRTKITHIFQKISPPDKSPIENTPSYQSLDTFKNIFSEEKYYMIGNRQPRLSADAYLVADVITGDVILSQSRNEIYPIASVTKLMTALVTKDLDQHDTTATIISRDAIATEGFRGDLNSGEIITTKELLYPLLLVSSNDAAEALAEHFDRDLFLKRMNERAQEIGMHKTYFDDPSGLSPKNTSTAEDLFTLTRYISLYYPDLIDITTQSLAQAEHHQWSNINSLRRFGNFFQGGKTGYTSIAKQTSSGIFTLPTYNNTERKFVIIILGSPEREKDISRIITYIKNNVYYGNNPREILPKK